MKLNTGFLIIILLLGYSSVAQKIIVSGQESSGKLKWADFRGTPDPQSNFYASTAYNFSYSFGKILPVGDSLIISDFEFVLEFDEFKSWVVKGKETDELLAHEQGHFNLGILNGREVINLIKGAKFTKENIRTRPGELLQDISKKYSDMSVLYDAETKHSMDKEQQGKWNGFFKEQLPTLY